MKTLLLFLSLLITGCVHAANPSFGQFDTNDFVTVNGVSVKFQTNANSAVGNLRGVKLNKTNDSAFNLTVTTNLIIGTGSNAMTLNSESVFGVGVALIQNGQNVFAWSTNGASFNSPDPGNIPFSLNLISRFNYGSGTPSDTRTQIGAATTWNQILGLSNQFSGPLYGSGSGLTNIPLTGLVNGADILTNAYAGRATVQSLTVSNSALPVTLSNNVVGVLQANGDFTAQAITSLSGSGFFGVGTSLTALNASQLTSGTVPNAALTNITRTNLNLVAGNHTNVASVNPTNNVLTVTGGLTNGTLSTATDRFGVDANGRMKGGNGGWAASGVGFTVYNLGEIGISSSGGPSYTTTSDTKLTRVSAGTFTGHTNLHMMGEVTATNGFYFPSGTGITNAWLTNNAALDFTDTAAGTRTTLTINLTNASEGDFVILSVPPNVAQHTTAVIAKYSASVTNGYINVNYDNLNLLSSQDPPAGNFRVIVQKWK